jgi:hypothetical protein
MMTGAEVGEPADPGEQPFDKELRGQGRDSQIKAFDLQGRQAEDHADQRRDQAGEDKIHQDGDRRQAQRQVVGGEGAHRHETAGAQRQLAGIAG